MNLVAPDQVETHFAEAVRRLLPRGPGLGVPGQGGPGRQSGVIRAGSSLTASCCLQLFDAQLTSRHADLAARWLQAKGAGFYTIGSSGHEGNAGVAAALRFSATGRRQRHPARAGRRRR